MSEGQYSISIADVDTLNSLHTLTLCTSLAALPTLVCSFCYTVHPVRAPLELLLSFLQIHPHVSTHIRKLCIQGGNDSTAPCVPVLAVLKVLRLASHATHLTLRNVAVVCSTSDIDSRIEITHLLHLVVDSIILAPGTSALTVLSLSSHWRTFAVLNPRPEDVALWQGIADHANQTPIVERLLLNVPRQRLTPTATTGFLSSLRPTIPSATTYLFLQNINNDHAAGLGPLLRRIAPYLRGLRVDLSRDAFGM